MRPYDLKSEDQACKMRSTHHDVGPKHWILTDGYRISLTEQEVGSEPTQHIIIPRAIFNDMVNWYMRDQKPAKRR